MMNWNQNDTKYILKRIILYFIIAGIVFFAGHSCSKAAVQTVSKDYVSQQNNIATIVLQGQLGKGMGQGYVIGNIWVNPNNTYNYGIKQIVADVWETNGSAHYSMVCEIGNMSGYTDNTNNYQMYSFKCPANLNNNVYIRYIDIFKVTSDNNPIYSGDFITFVSNDSEASAIINANNQAIQNQINAGNTNSQAIQNAINTSTQNEINAINNQTTAINNQTTAINNQTDWFDQDYSSIIDTEFLDVFDDLFDNDDDVVRQFILIPLNFFVLIYNACSSNSCSPIELGELYGTTLTIPCINWASLVGTAVTNTIDIIFAGCLVFGMIRMIKKMINKIMTLSSTITDECGVEVFK